MTAPAQPVGIEALDVPLADLEARIAAGHRAESRHLLLDADPDSTVPAFVDLVKRVRLVVVR